MAPRRRAAVALGAVLLVVVAAALLLGRARRGARQALVAAEAPRFVSSLRLLDRPPAEVALGLLTATGEAYDAAWQDGRLHVATGGGLLVYDGDVAAPRLLTHLDGLSGVALRALLPGPAGGELLVGDDGGGLSRLGPGRDGAQVQALRLGTAAGEAAPGPVVDLIEHEGARYLLVRQRGLLRLDGDEVIDEGRRAGLGEALLGAAAVCAGRAGLFVGTEGGALYERRGGRLAPAGQVDGPLTALSCAGDEVLIGTALGLLRRRPGGDITPLAADLLVTTILEQGASVLVGTLDDGVLALAREGERLVVRGHLLPGRRVRRLRASPDGPRGAGVAVALGVGAFVLGPGGPRPLAPPAAALSGPHVTALCRDGGGRLWIGTFEQGIDLVEPGTFPGPAPRLAHRPVGAGAGHGAAPRLAHRPVGAGAGHGAARADNVNALLCRPGAAEVIAATAGGVDIYGPDGASRRIGVAEGLLGEAVQALAPTPAGLWAATGRGLSLLPLPPGPAAALGLTAFHGLLGNRLYALAATDDRLYVGTLAGLSVVELRGGGGRPAGGHGAAALGAGWVSALARCGSDLYIGTYGGPLSVLRVAGAEAPRRLPGPRLHVNPGALLCDEGGVWAGTGEAGLVRLDRGAAAPRALDPALLPARSVTALHRDGDGTLLVGTEAGLVLLGAADALRPSLRPLPP